MKDDKASKYRESKNKFIAVLRSAMHYEKSQKMFLALDFIGHYVELEEDPKLTVKNISVLAYYFNLDFSEMEKIMEALRQTVKHRPLFDVYIEKQAEKKIEKQKKIFIEKGIEKGIEKEQRIAAINMYNEGFNNSLIAKILNISVNKVEDIIKNYKENN